MRWYQRFVRDVLHPADLWRSGDSAKLQYLREFEASQFLPPEALRELQQQRLGKLLQHAYQQSDYYRERFDAAGVRPSDIRTPEDLGALPVLEKRDIQENRDRLIARNWPKGDLIPNQTGGSTGRPLSFFLSRDRAHSRAGATLRHNSWAGWNVGDKAAVLWGAPRDLPSNRWRSRIRNLLIDRQLVLDTGHVTEAKLEAFHRAVHRFRPKVFQAYAGSIVLFARFLHERGLAAYQPKAIITSAEVLEPADRLLVEEVFGCRVFNRYGCREVSVLASECNQHNGLHVMAEGLLIEIVTGSRPALPGEDGAILVTDLLNFAMPLIRYRIGDIGSWAEGVCPCGRGLPRLRHVVGRATDFLVGADGRLVSGVFLATYLVAQRPSLGQVQILQERAGQMLYRIHAGPAFRASTDLAYLREATCRFLGRDTVVDWQLVDELKPEPSGKFLFSRSTAAMHLWEHRNASRNTAAPAASHAV